MAVHSYICRDRRSVGPWPAFPAPAAYSASRLVSWGICPTADVRPEPSHGSRLRLFSTMMALMSALPMFSTVCVHASCHITWPSGRSASTLSPPGR